MARVHHCVVLARQLAAAALRACSHMADGESAKRIEGRGITASCAAGPGPMDGWAPVQVRVTTANGCALA